MLGSAKDLPQPTTTPEYEWDPKEPAASLKHCKEFVVRRAKDAIAYYQYAKRPKKRRAIYLRIAALLFAGAAGLLPIFSQIMSDSQNATFQIEPAWASVFLALAAGAVALDRFLGYSSAWMRFMGSELKARRVTDEFELDWETVRAGWPAEGPSAAEAQQLIQRAKTFMVAVSEIVREETEQWISEFRETIKQLDDSARAAAAAEQRGAINVTVANGEATTGWELVVDGGPPHEYHGKSAALSNLVPGLHRVQVRGQIGGKNVQAEMAVAVGKGELAVAELTLS
jgi:hypothetical protein